MIFKNIFRNGSSGGVTVKIELTFKITPDIKITIKLAAGMTESDQIDSSQLLALLQDIISENIVENAEDNPDSILDGVIPIGKYTG